MSSASFHMVTLVPSIKEVKFCTQRENRTKIELKLNQGREERTVFQFECSLFEWPG